MSAKWGAITAAEVVASLEGELVQGSENTRFYSFSSDSRNIKRGCLFWALQGDKFDGHEFSSQAIEKGAAGVVVRKGFNLTVPAKRDVALIAAGDTRRALGDLSSWWRHEHQALVVAITGSAGKTTTKEMTATILAERGSTLKNRGNFNNLIGLPVTLLSMEDKHRYAVLEMGMNRPGEIGRLTEIADPEIGVITNVAKAHLEGVGTLEGVARAKIELIERMSPFATAVLNGDDSMLMKAAFPFCRKTLSFGMGPKNDVRAEKVFNLGREGISFDICHGGRRFGVKLKLPGLQNVHNALAATAVALHLGLSSDEVVDGLCRVKNMKGRFVITELPDGVILVDDTYNCNPLSLRAAMDSLKSLTLGRKVIVGLGEMFELGDETVRAHLEAGAMVADLGADFFVALGEHANVMIQGALDKGFYAKKAVVAEDREDMEHKIRREMKEGVFVFLKGSRKAGLDEVAERLKSRVNESKD
ncbi:MAG: UDP-N-acetylmuramoyl-tripeptide--D-alanyl-D-alanine ligase [Deltaproteobacteria bacterium]|nr:UDP-N-acetylmuramoyl-tripeptide--D-alanyl-D-alanine ligase [Deltaproteobacteria bacterium]